MADSDSKSSLGADGSNATDQHEAANHIEIHRVNDLSYGHVGRVSYKPSDDQEADIGDLNLNRITEQPPFFQEVSPFEEWIPPSRTSLPRPFDKTSQFVRSQRIWLLKTRPEAFLGNADLQQVLSEQVQASRRHDEGEDSQPASLLSIGEINDASKTSLGACPAIAMAAGEAGHILRLSTMQVENWSWDRESTCLQMGASKSIFQGFWCHDGVPISQIKFATKRKKYDNTRWLIVQRSTSTTIFEPQLRKTPLNDPASRCYLDSGKPSHIAANPIITLTKDTTGGDSQCDFAFDPGPNDGVPQLAIIDRAGNWSIWYVTREPSRTAKTARTTLRSRGAAAGISSPWISTSPWTSNPRIAPAARYQCVWVGHDRRIEDWGRDESPSESSKTTTPAHRRPFVDDIEAFDSTCDRLLICDSTSLQLLDIAGATTISNLNFCKRNSEDRLLDARRFPGSPSLVFLLTTKKLFLLDLAKPQDQESNRPTVLISCLHFRFQDQECLKMTMAMVHSPPGEVSTLIFLFSAQSTHIKVFCVTQAAGNVRFHQQVLHISALSFTTSSNLRGLESLTAIPLHMLYKTSRGHHLTSNTVDGVSKIPGLQYYQLVGLGVDLSLNASLIAMTNGHRQALMPPDRSTLISTRSWGDVKRTKLFRRKFVRDTEKSFVLPDDTDNTAIALRQSVVKQSAARSTTQIVQLRYYLLRLFQEIHRSLNGDAAALDDPGSGGVEPFYSIRAAIQEREGGGHIALKPLLGFSDHLQHFNPSEVGDDWSVNLERLQKIRDVQVLDHGTYSRKLSVADFFEMLSVNWSAKMPAELLNSTQWECVKMALERMAAEVYLSERGMKLVPQPILQLEARAAPLQAGDHGEAGIDKDELALSQRMSQIALPTPSATPSSSRATSEATELGSAEGQDGGDQDKEDPVVARMRMYLRSEKFVPPSRHGPSRVLSLWPEQRGSDPEEYNFSLKSKASTINAGMEEARKRRQKGEDRRRKKAEKKAQLGVERRVWESVSQPMPRVVHSSPPPQRFSQGESQSQSQGFGLQTMSQPATGGFGARPKIKKPKKRIGFR